MTYTARRSGPAGPRGERFLALVEEARERHRRLHNAAARREEADAGLTHRRFVEDARAELARCERILRNVAANGYDVGDFVYDCAVADVAAARRELSSLTVVSS